MCIEETDREAELVRGGRRSRREPIKLSGLMVRGGAALSQPCELGRDLRENRMHCFMGVAVRIDT